MTPPNISEGSVLELLNNPTLEVIQICGVASGARIDACVLRALSRCTTLKVDDQNRFAQ